jgi:LemA protein
MAAANDQLSGALGRLIAVSENYPQLKSDAHFTELMREIAGSENRIAVARRDYNDAIKRYNVKIETFPGNMFAGMMGYAPMKQFAADEAAHAVPQVKF